MKDAIAHLICFLVGHDLQLYRLTYRNQTRLVCRRCQHPYADTLKNVCQRLLQRVLTRRGNSDELPF
jgi:hypothetical protein